MERASGVTLSDYLEQRHLHSAGNGSHVLGRRQRHLVDRAQRATRAARGGFVRSANRGIPAWLAGDAGLVTTIDDLAKWDIEMPVLLARRRRSNDVHGGRQHRTDALRYGLGDRQPRRQGVRLVERRDFGLSRDKRAAPEPARRPSSFSPTPIRFTEASRSPKRSARACSSARRRRTAAAITRSSRARRNG